MNSSMTANLKYADIIWEAKHLNLLLFTLFLSNICALLQTVYRDSCVLYSQIASPEYDFDYEPVYRMCMHEL